MGHGQRSPLTALLPLFDDLVRSLRELLADYSLEQLETIHHFLTEAAQRQQAATTGLSKRRTSKRRRR